MTSNPFRRSMSGSSPAATPSSQHDHLPAIDTRLGSERATGVPPPPTDPTQQQQQHQQQPTKMSKQVRINSAPTSPEYHSPPVRNSLGRRVSLGNHEGSPPPPIRPEIIAERQGGGRPHGGVTSDDPFDGEDSASTTDDEALTNMLQNQEIPVPPSASVQTPSSSSIANPFSRTLATMTPKSSGQGVEDDDERVDPRSKKEKKPMMDVGAFGKMLMGKGEGNDDALEAPPPRNRLPSVSFGGETHIDDNPPTPASPRRSIEGSRHEVFGAAASSPRRSLEGARPDPRLEEAFGHTVTSPPPKAKPPPPEPKYGKSVTSRNPQTVSFADFEASMDSSSASSMNNSTSNSTSRAQQVTSPLSEKPLPPIPLIAPSPRRSLEVTNDTTTPAAVSEEKLDEVRSPSKKQAPAVPVARRASILKNKGANHARGRSNSSLAGADPPLEAATPSTSSESGDIVPASSLPPPPAASASSSTSTTTKSSSKPPPIPPTRRQNSSSARPLSLMSTPSPQPEAMPHAPPPQNPPTLTTKDMPLPSRTSRSPPSATTPSHSYTQSSSANATTGGGAAPPRRRPSNASNMSANSATHPPPLPPPRRGRKSSTDTPPSVDPASATGTAADHRRASYHSATSIPAMSTHHDNGDEDSDEGKDSGIYARRPSGDASTTHGTTAAHSEMAEKLHAEALATGGSSVNVDDEMGVAGQQRSTDLLAEMAQLQREIDALRAKSG